MRKAVLGVVTLAVLATFCSTPAGATVYGALTVKQIQDPGTAPNPIGVPNPSGSAAGDTVGPVTGIITGFDKFPTGFATYIQMPGPGPWTGIDVFTGGRNLLSEGFALGDDISVEGALAEFSTAAPPCPTAGVDGETEIIAKNGSFGSNLTITKLSSGNPIPPFHVGTTAELQELCTNPNAERWEGCLVRVNGPLRICRTNAQPPGLGTFRAALVVNNTLCPDGSGGPCDSLFLDLSTLADPALAPGNVGQLVDYAQGIYSQRSRGYRIQCRDGNDYGLQAPPNLVRAFAIANDTYRVIMDRDVTVLTAEDESKYTIASLLGPPDVATQIDPTTIDLTITPVLDPGDVETVTVNGLTAANSGLTMTSGQATSFHFGVLSPAQVQGPDPDSIAANPCRDVALYQTGGPVTIRAICTARFTNTYYLQGSNTPRDGMAVFAPPAALELGRRYVIVGSVQERFDETQMSTIVYVADEGPFTIPSPVVQTIPVLIDASCDFPAPHLGTNTHETTGEDYEDMLVRVLNVKSCENDLSGRNFQITTYPPTADSIFVANLTGSAYTYTPNENHVLNVTGVLHFTFGAFEICPRSDADIQIVGTLGTDDLLPSRVSLVVAPNPAQRPRVTFALPTAQKAELSVYDVVGRQVAVVARGEFIAGTHTRTWNGLDGTGNPARAGMYFYKLKLDGGTHVVRAIKLD